MIPSARDLLKTQVQSEGENWSCEREYEDVRYTFDRVENLVKRSGQQDKTEFVWDVNGRLVESICGGSKTTYAYDPLGRRISKETDGVVTRFYWDGDALLGDVTDDDTREWVYYPGSFEPLVMIRNEEFYLYHNDPNGCPTRLFDESGKVVWAARYDAWGEVKKLVVEEVEQPLRLQGQYFDRETGLYYNRFRYYEPIIGTFVSQDPLGLAAGENVYGFGPNVQKWIDPLGLCKTQTSKNTLHTISKDKSVIVVGESMSRVNKVADELKSLGYDVKTYDPRKFRSFTPDNPGVHPLDMEANRSWLRYWTKGKNATVVDIGLDSARTLPRSPFYQMENRSLYSNWNNNNVIKYDPGF